MPLITINLTDSQVANLIGLAADLRQLHHDLREYFAKRPGAIRPRGKQRNPHRPRLFVNGVPDPWFDILSEIKDEQISTMDVFLNHIGLNKERVSPVDAKRVAAIMKRLGWDGPKMIRDRRTMRVMRGYERTSANLPEGWDTPDDL